MNYNTPLDQVFFRAHAIGALIPEKAGTKLTDKMLEKLEDYENRMRTGAKISPNQIAEMIDYQNRRDTPPELGDGGKSFVETTWLWHEKGFRKRIKSKFLDKGIYQESESRKLLTELDGIFYAKNLERVSMENITGECDIKTKIGSTTYIDDIKSSWDAETFMNAGWDTLKEWQGRTYLKLYGGDVFRLRYCLTDCPSHIVTKQKEYLWREFYDDSMSDEETHRLEEMLVPMYEQIERNLIYTNSKLYTPEERVKTYTLERDDERFEYLEEKIRIALEYYQTITLNRLVGKSI